jgi:hypothetical protein
MSDSSSSNCLKDKTVPYAPPPETQRLIDELYRQELLDARAMPLEEKALAGQRLFEAACRITLAGIRNQHPEFSEEHCQEMLRQRLDFQRRLEASA